MEDFIYDPSLALYLPLYELDGASIMDRSAYGYSCSVSGALWAPNGHWFDGSNDEITHPTLLDTFPSALTLIAWVNLESGTGESNYVCGKENITGQDRFRLDKQADETLRLFTEGSNLNVRSAVTVGTMSLATWHFCYGVYEATVKPRVGLDAEEVTGGTASEAIQDGTDEDFVIGSSVPGAAAELHLGGLIGGFWLYNRALTVVELQYIRLATKWRCR